MNSDWIVVLGGHGPWRRAVVAAVSSCLGKAVRLKEVQDAARIRTDMESGVIVKDADLVVFFPSGADSTAVARDTRRLRGLGWEGGMVVALANVADRADLLGTPLIPGILTLGDAPGFRVVDDPQSLTELLVALEELTGFYQERWLDLSSGALQDLSRLLVEAERGSIAEGLAATLQRATNLVDDISWLTLVPHQEMKELQSGLVTIHDMSRNDDERLSALRNILSLTGLGVSPSSRSMRSA